MANTDIILSEIGPAEAPASTAGVALSRVFSSVMSAPTSFRSAAGFRRWLTRHYAGGSELLVRLFKVHAKHLGLTYREALDEALCFGWIDGVRRGHDADSFLIRFTPRKSASYWSDVNVKRAKELVAEGRMHAAGLATFRRHDPARAPRYSFESAPREFDAAALRRFRADKKAWAFFQKQAPWYRQLSAFRVMSAKRPETRLRRLDQIIEQSRAEVPIEVLRRNPKATS